MLTQLEIVLIILVLVLLAFTVVSIRQVRILNRELKETQRGLPKQSIKAETKNQNRREAQGGK